MKFLKRKGNYFIKKEKMGDKEYYIYRKFLVFNIFFEKWKSEVTAKARLEQLKIAI
jgi:hypothetical protein